MSAGETVSRAEKKAQSRRRILDAAKAIFFSDGFVATNLDKVADHAGVAKGTLYRYFESKADLYVAMLAEDGRVFTEKLAASAQSGSTAAQRIQSMSRFYLDHWTQHPDYFRIFWAIDNQDLIGEVPEEIVDEVARLWEECLAIVSTVLDAGVVSGEFKKCDTWEVATIFWTTANALIQSDSTRARRQLRKLPLEKVFHDAIQMLLLGLASPTSRLRS
jgi:AcrR family transcriptional regulator